jgi:hypothetical protein
VPHILGAGARQFCFMLQGLREVQASLKARDKPFFMTEVVLQEWCSQACTKACMWPHTGPAVPVAASKAQCTCVSAHAPALCMGCLLHGIGMQLLYSFSFPLKGDHMVPSTTDGTILACF